MAGSSAGRSTTSSASTSRSSRGSRRRRSPDVAEATDAAPPGGGIIGGVFAFFGVLIALYGLIEALGGLGTLLRRGWGRVLGFMAALPAVTLMTFGVIGSFSAVSSLGAAGIDTSEVGSSGIVGLAIVIGIVALYWFTLFALITGGTHFRRR